MKRIKYSSMSHMKRRSGRISLDNVKYFAGSCVLVFVLGNMMMFYSYYQFVLPVSEPSDRWRTSVHDTGEGWRKLPDRNDHTYDQNDIESLLNGFLSQWTRVPLHESVYSVSEGGIRKLMEDNRSDGLLLQLANVLRPSSYRVDADATVRTMAGEIDRSGDWPMLGCAEISQIKNLRFLGSGWTKAVYRGVWGDHNVAVKTVDISGHDITTCLEKYHNMSHCYTQAAGKILKEIVLLQTLAHQNVVKLLGFCLPPKPFDGDVDTAVAMVTELGEPIDQIQLLQMSWEDRLRVSYDIIVMLEYLAHSPYGSLALNDFRRNQFVLVNSRIKLTDVDDAGFGEPSCVRSSECTLRFEDSNITKHIKCVQGRCKGYNEFQNIHKAGQHFTTFLLPHGAPRALKPYVQAIVSGFHNLSMDTHDLLQEMEKVVHLYTSGAYLNRQTDMQHIATEYQLHKGHDLPGQFDYRCRFSVSAVACTLTVFDLKEAGDICDLDEECQGFVWTQEKSWTGRTVIHLKNGLASPSVNPNTDLYIKPP